MNKSMKKLILKPPKVSYKTSDFITLNIPLQVNGMINKPYFSYDMKVKWPEPKQPVQKDYHRLDSGSRYKKASTMAVSAQSNQYQLDRNEKKPKTFINAHHETSKNKDQKGRKQGKGGQDGGPGRKSPVKSRINRLESLKKFRENEKIFDRKDFPYVAQNADQQTHTELERLDDDDEEEIIVVTSMSRSKEVNESYELYNNSHPYSMFLDSSSSCINCLYKPSIKPSPYLMIYFHSRGTDAGSAMPFANTISACLFINLLVVEYPGYGVRAMSSEPDPVKLLEEARHLIFFLTEIVGMNPETILIGGRSLGCAPSMYLASRSFGLSGSLGGVFLISPFTCLRDVASDWIKGSGVGGFLAEGLENFLFGKKNKRQGKLVVKNLKNFLQEEELAEERKDEPKYLLSPRDMGLREKSFRSRERGKLVKGRRGKENRVLKRMGSVGQKERDLELDSGDIYNLMQWVEDVRIPILFIHGENDKVFGKSHSIVSQKTKKIFTAEKD